MHVSPFSLLVDGSNDVGVEKLNPLTVRIYDNSSRQVITHLLDMCTTTGRNCGTADAIFTKINAVLQSFHIPWSNCIGFGVDNTSVNVGIRNSIMTRVKQQNDCCYFMGCPCHLVHNVAGHASETLQKSCGFDVEDLCVDVYYWFEKSTKRKGILKEFCEFCDNQYREIVRYVSVRWLSLEKAVHRILLLYETLKSYFNSEYESQARFGRLLSAFRDPMTEVYLFFYQSILPTFTHLNLLLQREDPNIYLVADEIRAFLQKLLSKFVKLRVIKAANDITAVDFLDSNNQLDNSTITIGLLTRQRLRCLLEEGDITDHDFKKFIAAVRAFYQDASSQALQKLPFTDCVLNHAKFLNFEIKEECTFDAVEFFCERYSGLLNFSPPQMNQLQEEFVAFQLLEEYDIPQVIWNEAIVYDEGGKEGTKHYRMDSIWGHIATIKNVNGSCRFELLSKVAKLVLVIPHSNAGEERVFNLIRQNKTPTRSCLNPNGTLASIIQVKLANRQPCLAWDPPKPLLSASKKATVQYNSMHKNK